MENSIQFDETSIDWKPLPDPEGNPTDHISLSFLNVDDNAKIVDILFKFSANEKILMHRHTSTIVFLLSKESFAPIFLMEN